MDEQEKTTLALAGATYSLLSVMTLELVKKGVFTTEEALGIVQRTRAQLEAQNHPGGIRASVLLEPLAADLERAKGG